MRIKRFESFSHHTDIESIKQDVDDVFSYLRDYGFVVEIEDYIDSNGKNIEEEVSIRIVKSEFENFSDREATFIIEGHSDISEELKDSILRTRDMMRDWKLQMEVKYKMFPDEYSQLTTKDIKIEDDKFVYLQPLVFDEEDEYGFDYDEEEVDMPILILMIFFTRISLK